ncbi:delta-aminolevulinic acid dehydratase [Thermoplasmatales archaeon SG8-52-4]|nr:MAG: delta-aminolevulinic acid dehydratase [Thermoplasmatales archaeon SG8-52-4]
MTKTIEESFKHLSAYCIESDFKGWDPYDGLNSKLFQFTPLKHWSLARLAWIQLYKRSPINLRSITLTPKGYNPKGLGLFLSAYCNLYKINPQKEILNKINFLANKIIELQSLGYSGASWGYNFDWQNRAFFQPKYTPTVVVTSFVANALFDAFDLTGDEKFFKVALSSGDFVVKDLNREQVKEGFIFSYSPLDHTKVYNASLLGARLLARGCSYKKKDEWLELSQIATQTIINKQKKDGSWEYGDGKRKNWIDSFHTGFNLECIQDYMRYTGDYSFQKALKLGLKFYLDNFFLNDGTPKYYHNQIYPIDIHAPAQLIVTITKLNLFKEHQRLIEKVLNWTIKNMQNNNGYFYYQLKRIFSSKISYMRWSQAWMFYAFCKYLNAKVDENLD